MRIIGIDPGIERTGWGVISKSKQGAALVDCGCIVTKRNKKAEVRLLQLFTKVVELAKKFNPEKAAVEKLFFNKNVKTALGVGEARGVIILSLVQEKIPIYHYTPLEIKLAVAGYGRAGKQQVKEMVKTLLKLDKVPSPDDVADALAVAITHSVTFKANDR